MEEGTVTTQPRARSFIIKRPRLTKILDESEARILLLVAPAGYGKTTLAREWLEGKPGVAWYSGGPSMADVAALAAGIAEALDPALADRVRLLAANQQPPEALAHTIASSNAAKACLILAVDDCQYAAESQEAVAFLSELLLRTDFRVVAASRVRPVWVTPRMLVYGDATALDMNALAFTDDETNEIVDASSWARPTLNAAGGWPAVIGLVARRGETGAPVRGLEASDLYEFFAENLFNAAAPELKPALYLLALGADTTRAIAQELLGPTHDRLLADAVELGFLSGGKAGGMHPLLRGFLLSKLEQDSSFDLGSALTYVTAALIKNARWDACLAVLEVFPKVDIINAVLDQALVELLSAGRTTTVRRLVAIASDNDVANPMTLLAEAELALREGDTQRAQVLAERGGHLACSGDRAARAFVVAGRAAHLRDDHVAARAHCSKAETLATSLSTKLEALWVHFASTVEDENRSDAFAVLERMRHVSDGRPDHTLRVHNAMASILLELDKEPRAAAQEFALASGLLAHVHDPVQRTNFLNLRAHVFVVLGEYEAALELARLQTSEAAQSGLDFAIDHGILTQAGALVGLRRFREAQRLIGQLEASQSARSDFILRNTHLMVARLRIATGDLDRAEILLRYRAGTSADPWLEQLAYRGLVFAALGNCEEADLCLSEAQSRGRGVDRWAVAELGRAVLAMRNDNVEAARLSLAEVVERGCGDAVVTACRAFPDLACLGTQQELAHALTVVLAKSRDIDLARHAGLSLPRELRKREPLTTREREVYELLAQGRTNYEIAQTLFISSSTTKVHVRHIFEKLGVHTRAEAAALGSPDR